jgi:MscS family membrane protein
LKEVSVTGFIESLGISSSPYVIAGLAMIAFVVIAKIADLFVDKVMRRFTQFTSTDIDDRIIDIIHRPVFFTIIILGMTSPLSYLELALNKEFFGNGVFYTFLTLIWAVTVVRISKTVIAHSIEKFGDTTGLRNDIVPLVENVLKTAVGVAALMVILSLWNVDITPLIASAGIVGAAVAFASKDTIANFFGGISVFIDRPFCIGDYIVLDKGERGEVVAIGVRSTRIKTRDDIQITIPNSIIANTKIINESAPVPKFRVRIPLSVAYGTDIDQVERILLGITKENENVISDPLPRVRFREFGECSLNFELLCWASEPAVRGLMVHQLNSAIYKKFNETGIKIPFPQRDVYMHHIQG